MVSLKRILWLTVSRVHLKLLMQIARVIAADEVNFAYLCVCVCLTDWLLASRFASHVCLIACVSGPSLGVESKADGPASACTWRFMGSRSRVIIVVAML